MVILNKGSKVAAALWSDAFGGESILMIVTGTVEESTKSQVKFIDEGGGIFTIESKLGKMTGSAIRQGKELGKSMRVHKLSPLTEKYLLADFAEDVKGSVGGHEVGKEERS
jgi:hypothetical protein